MVTERFGRETTGNRIRLTDRLFRILLGVSPRARGVLVLACRCRGGLVAPINYSVVFLLSGAGSGTSDAFWLRDPRLMYDQYTALRLSSPEDV
jgi:hypothetical protein